MEAGPMNNQAKTAEQRELTMDELDHVSGGKVGGIKQNPEPMGDPETFLSMLAIALS
jgi:hypothetical protein